MADDVRAMVGLNIRRLRMAAGLTQAELAERMGVTNKMKRFDLEKDNTPPEKNGPGGKPS